MSEKMCVKCGLVKEMPMDFDIDNHNMTGYTAKCKECRGTLPVKRVKKARKSRQAKLQFVETESDLPNRSVEELDAKQAEESE